MSVTQASVILLAAWVAGCSSMQDLEKEPPEKELALDAPPYFPRCVAQETGTYRQREIDRHMWWPVEFQVDDATPITDECMLVQP